MKTRKMPLMFKYHTFRPISNKQYLTGRFQIAVRLFTNRSQGTSKCGKNKKVAHEAQPSGIGRLF